MAMNLAELADSGYLARDWAEALEPMGDRLAELGRFLNAERADGQQVLPAGDRILSAFQRPLADVRVLIVGQDPYPTPGHPIGLSFATAPDVRPIPRSLQNIYREMREDLGIEPAPHGDLSAWADHGVMLLNRVLTVRAGTPASHRGKGWEAFTEHAIRALVARGGPLVAILWGNDARSLGPMLGDVPRIESPHPSPLSASRGFFGSKPFSRANAALEAQGAAPVDWRVAPAAG
ncbi:uracil-DNA glycosylase [Leucobacter sp. OLJS4]|uniref:uracil-DNA glycosylase n=1 Tax=unclassified Leucobacter TaxID=2621730 RepID=UPI000C186BBD|nr:MULTISPECIES: uracil-DNA glycosylase [unclassified Leucobacter]PIJ48646.1 uracil-DNA glycosylase [Leucobacter sp. OLES1]PII83372.1 uracil-DNA glycosylase [Leucobacter sp. OLCALW19]PII86922.1 uracil-DNA glycosylase [Leucobacter sp. OLTLW20]PII89238.1 uracil-DNA glycosylase [Leucobacter sp. OLAS13]PII99079.1 uracil-DNA glycosylase [Leucobacter sp. OLCS4]